MTADREFSDVTTAGFRGLALRNPCFGHFLHPSTKQRASLSLISYYAAVFNCQFVLCACQTVTILSPMTDGVVYIRVCV